MELPEKIANVTEELGKIPGIGKKSALRHALYLAGKNDLELDGLVQSIHALSQLKNCQSCGLFSDEEICHICANDHRVATGVICVVENISDCLAIENSKNYQGTYHILHGVLNPLMGIGPDDLKIDHLIEKCRQNVHSVILAINSSVEGDATSSYIREHLPDHVTVERIGFGIPMGGSLEYLDALTISKALENRKRMD